VCEAISFLKIVTLTSNVQRKIPMHIYINHKSGRGVKLTVISMYHIHNFILYVYIVYLHVLPRRRVVEYTSTPPCLHTIVIN
jgi:hypothetical protein